MDNNTLDNLLLELDSINLSSSNLINLDNYNEFINTVTDKIKLNNNLKDYFDIELKNGSTLDNLVLEKLNYIDTKKKNLLDNLKNKQKLVQTYLHNITIIESDRTILFKKHNTELQDKIANDQIELNNIEEHKLHLRNKCNNSELKLNGNNELTANLLLYSMFEDIYYTKYIKQLDETINLLTKQKNELITEHTNKNEQNKYVKESLINNSNYNEIYNNILNLINKI
tara:strand:- start:807 stop:1487 length:681 start_codon:yes stop_codon:yes gene_type:complete